MTVIDSAEQFIEDLMMLEDQPTLVQRTTAESPVWEIVFPMGREVIVQRLLQKHLQILKERLGSEFSILPRTILYHLALERFSSLTSSRIELVSTNITNITKPNIHAVKRYGTVWLGYEIDCIAVGSLVGGEPKAFSQLAAHVSHSFNLSSRYLRIERLGAESVPTKTSPPPARVQRVALEQPPGAGIPTYLLDNFAARRGRKTS